MIRYISSYSREFLFIPNFATALGHLLPYLTAEEAKQQGLHVHNRFAQVQTSSTCSPAYSYTAIMTSGRGFGLLGVNPCPRGIEDLVFGLFECGVGEIDGSRRIVLG